MLHSALRCHFRLFVKGRHPSTQCPSPKLGSVRLGRRSTVCLRVSHKSRSVRRGYTQAAERRSLLVRIPPRQRPPFWSKTSQSPMTPLSGTILPISIGDSSTSNSYEIVSLYTNVSSGSLHCNTIWLDVLCIQDL